MLAKDFDFVTFLAVDSCHINHTSIHTDISDVCRLLSIDKTISHAIAQMPVEPVCIADWNGRYACRAVYRASSAIAHSFTGLYVAYLQYGGNQRAYVVYYTVVRWVYAIQAKSQTHHIKVVLRETLNSGSVADVPDNLMLEVALKFACH